MAATKVKGELPHPREDAMSDGLREVVRACCRRAEVQAVRIPQAAAVHEARRELKRARAVLRIAESLDVAGADAARKRLAARARELSALRDAAVTAKMARRLAEEANGRGLTRKPVAVPARERGKSARWRAAWKRRLAAERRRLDRLTWGEPSARDVEAALEWSAKRVGKRARKACASDITTLHAWRKTVIVLREQLAVVGSLIDRKTARLRELLDCLAQRLGKAMDCEVFLHAVRRGGAEKRLEALARKRQRRAIERAWECWPKVRKQLAKLR